MITQKTRNKWDKRIKFLRAHPEHITEWESNFLLSIRTKRFYHEVLSLHQSFKLNEIYNRVDWKIG